MRGGLVTVFFMSEGVERRESIVPALGAIVDAERVTRRRALEPTDKTRGEEQFIGRGTIGVPTSNAQLRKTPGRMKAVMSISSYTYIPKNNLQFT